MKKITEVLVEQYKKANSRTKATILKKFSFDTEKEFLEYCGVKTKPKTVHNVHILDRSGSMNGEKIHAAIKGINDELHELKNITDVQFTQTIITFSSGEDRKTFYWKESLDKVNPISVSAIGGTSLYDAIGETLSLLKMQNEGSDDKVLVKIFTDGEENSSMKWKAANIKKLIKQCEDSGFTITFVGTQGDIDTVIDRLAIHTSNTYAHQNTGASINLMSEERSFATSTYAKRVAAGEDVRENFFIKEIKK